MLIYLLILFFIVLFGMQTSRSKIKELIAERAKLSGPAEIEKSETLLKKHRLGMKIFKISLVAIVISIAAVIVFTVYYDTI
mgnify:CR=1 FL=1